MHPDLGVYMNRHSTAATYLAIVLLAICGRIGVPGGNVFPGQLMPIGSHSDERDPSTWRTVATDFPAIMGTFPPNVMPEEILSDRPGAAARRALQSDPTPCAPTPTPRPTSRPSPDSISSSPANWP